MTENQQISFEEARYLQTQEVNSCTPTYFSLQFEAQNNFDYTCTNRRLIIFMYLLSINPDEHHHIIKHQINSVIEKVLIFSIRIQNQTLI